MKLTILTNIQRYLKLREIKKHRRQQEIDRQLREIEKKRYKEELGTPFIIMVPPRKEGEPISGNY